MGSLVLVGLVIAWFLVLLPWGLRRRAERGSSNSIGNFHASLAAMHARRDDSVPRRPVGSYATIHPAARRASASVAKAKARRAKKRRRDVFYGLLASMIGSAVLALVPGFHVLWILNATVDTLFGAYVVLLMRMRAGAPCAVAPADNDSLPPSYEYALARAANH